MIYILIYWFIDLLIYLIIDSFFNWFIDSLIYLFIYWFIGLLF